MFSTSVLACFIVEKLKNCSTVNGRRSPVLNSHARVFTPLHVSSNLQVAAPHPPCHLNPLPRWPAPSPSLFPLFP